MANLLLTAAGQDRRGRGKLGDSTGPLELSTSDASGAHYSWLSCSRCFVPALAPPNATRDSSTPRKPATGGRVRRCSGSASTSTSEADGTTALHWAVRQDDLAAWPPAAFAPAPTSTAANRYGVTPLYLAGVNGNAADDRAAAEGRRRRERGGARRRDRADDGGAHRQRRGGARAAGARRQRGRARELARPDGADVGGRAEPSRDGPAARRASGADVNARSAVQNWERQKTQEPREKWLPPGGFTPLLFAARQGCARRARAFSSRWAPM